MRTVIARIFDYSLDGVIATEDTPFFDFCRELPDDPAQEDRTRALYAGADLHVMGRVAYLGGAGYFPTATDQARDCSATSPSRRASNSCRPSRSRTGP
jgi:dihydrofolate reductase